MHISRDLTTGNFRVASASVSILKARRFWWNLTVLKSSKFCSFRGGILAEIKSCRFLVDGSCLVRVPVRVRSSGSCLVSIWVRGRFVFGRIWFVFDFSYLGLL